MANNRYSGPFRNYYESNKFYTVGGSASGEIVPIPGPIKTVSATTIQYIYYLPLHIPLMILDYLHHN